MVTEDGLQVHSVSKLGQTQQKTQQTTSKNSGTRLPQLEPNTSLEYMRVEKLSSAEQGGWIDEEMEVKSRGREQRGKCK
jgi:hypothetical protein